MANAPPSGPREPWRTLGLIAVLPALAVLAVCSFAALIVVEAIFWILDRVRPAKNKPSRVGTKVHNWKSLAQSRRGE